mgnify:CR=1 FL=1
MKPSSTTTSIKRLLAHRLLSSAASLAVLIAGVASVSVPLLILSGVIAYGWPLLQVYLASLDEDAKRSSTPARKEVGSFSPSAVPAR